MNPWNLPSDRYEEIREEVSHFIEDFGISEYPFSMWVFFRRIGIRLIPYSILEADLRSQVEHAWPDAITLLPRDFNVVRTVIFYNDSQTRERVRFTLAHELGHIVLEHPFDESAIYEHEADFFANYLLAPAPLVIRDSRKSIDTIMADFGISRGCARSVYDRTCNRVQYGASQFLPYEQSILDNCELGEGREYRLMQF